MLLHFEAVDTKRAEQSVDVHERVHAAAAEGN